jgi:hypothetical protein
MASFIERPFGEGADRISLARISAKNPTTGRDYGPANTNPGKNEAPTKAYRSGEKWGTGASEGGQGLPVHGKYLALAVGLRSYG